MKFPQLYKMSNGGALQVWKIEAGELSSLDGVIGVIRTSWGQEDGVQQETEDYVKKGKNVGKANETTPVQQAEAEAQAKWTKQIERRGYVESRERALARETDAAGGIQPMLAQPLEKTKKIVFPCDAQRKYNGVRMIAVVEHGKCTLWSRKQTEMTACFPHIVAAYERLFAGPQSKHRYVFDGEAYRHGWSLQKISGYARVKEPKEGYEQIGHYVYDMPSCDTPWRSRSMILNTSIGVGLRPIFVVTSLEVNNMKEVKGCHDKWVQEGYEGVILRNFDAPYEAGKRSYQLAKYKEFLEQEFEIVAVGEGRGKFEGKAIFTCKTKKGKAFECCSPGTLEDRAEYLRRSSECIGKMLTVKFFDWTEEKIPQFPVGLTVRDYE